MYGIADMKRFDADFRLQLHFNFLATRNSFKQKQSLDINRASRIGDVNLDALPPENSTLVLRTARERYLSLLVLTSVVETEELHDLVELSQQLRSQLFLCGRSVDVDHGHIQLHLVQFPLKIIPKMLRLASGITKKQSTRGWIVPNEFGKKGQPLRNKLPLCQANACPHLYLALFKVTPRTA